MSINKKTILILATFLLNSQANITQAYAQEAIQINSFVSKPVLQRRSDSLNELGMQLIFKGQKEQGLEKLELAHKVEPTNPTVLYNLSGYYLTEKNYVSALISINRALEITPNDLQFLKRKTEALLPLRRFEDAISVFKRILTLDTRNGDSYCKLGAIYGLLNQWEESEKNLLQAREILGDSPSILNNLANARLMLKKNQEAIEVLEIAQHKWPSADREITLGVAYEGLGSNEQAVFHYRKAKELGAQNKYLDSHIERVK